MRYTLSIATDYVSHWGFWEGVREIIQNALDEQQVTDLCDVEITRNSLGNVLIRTSTGRLDPSSLLLGMTTKAGEGTRGQFGEGYKLALLVLSRLGHEVVIYNDDVVWTPKIEHDASFGADVLRILVEDLTPSEAGVTFRVNNVSDEQWDEVQRNLRDERSGDHILFDDAESGRVYVGGLYVATVKEFRYGYNLDPSTMKLDRDRGMVNGFDLSFVTSRLWGQRDDDERVYALLKDEAPDVTYLDSHITEESGVIDTIAEEFEKEYGTHREPVSNEREARRHQEAGVPFVIVPEQIKKALMKRSDWEPVRATGTPTDRLRRFMDFYQMHFTSQMREEMQEIIQLLGGGE